MIVLAVHNIITMNAQEIFMLIPATSLLPSMEAQKYIQVDNLLTRALEKLTSETQMESTVKAGIISDISEGRQLIRELQTSNCKLGEKINTLQEKLNLIEKSWAERFATANEQWANDLANTKKQLDAIEESWKRRLDEAEEKTASKFLELEGARSFERQQSLLLIRQLAYSYQYKMATIFNIGADPEKRFLTNHLKLAKKISPIELQKIRDLFDPSYDDDDIDVLVKNVRHLGVNLSHPTTYSDGIMPMDKVGMDAVINDACDAGLIPQHVAKSAKKLLNVVNTLCTDPNYLDRTCELLDSSSVVKK